jgi:hypothetical protein
METIFNAMRVNRKEPNKNMGWCLHLISQQLHETLFCTSPRIADASTRPGQLLFCNLLRITDKLFEVLKRTSWLQLGLLMQLQIFQETDNVVATLHEGVLLSKLTAVKRMHLQ